MEVADLMVGDWVNYKSPSSGKLRPIKIENIYGYEFNCEVENWNIISGKSISDTEPIPLTEEILVKNGFEQKNYLTYVSGQVEIIKNRDNWNVVINKYCVFVDMNIKFVHQLQHLLRLCGIEKEITL